MTPRFKKAVDDLDDTDFDSDGSLSDDQLEAAAAQVRGSQRSTVPAILTLKMRLGYDKAVKNYFEKEGGNVDNWLAEVMTHSQAHYLHSSLKHQIILQVQSYEIFNHILVPLIKIRKDNKLYLS